MIPVPGSITAPKGFAAAGVACGLKKDQRPDLALIVSEVPAVAAGVLRRNWSKAIPCSARWMIRQGFASAC
jgi:glutamate N-acetyltransferase/amino-acid N-acetyltransferase